LIEDPANQVLVSAATVWEIAIKHALARTDMPISGAEALDWFRLAGYDLLPISPEHAAAVERLPNHHRDPFDRLLVAQAQTRNSAKTQSVRHVVPKIPHLMRESRGRLLGACARCESAPARHQMELCVLAPTLGVFALKC